MKKVIVFALIMVFALSAVSAFAAEAAKGKPLSKEGDGSSFQAASDHIAKWGDSRPLAKELSLRDDKAELDKRRKGKCALGI
ncbi:MAG: hypothetical protein WBD00_04985 [Candidatus Omnitrophota bacterium]|jgi:hypothetical protein